MAPSAQIAIDPYMRAVGEGIGRELGPQILRDENAQRFIAQEASKELWKEARVPVYIVAFSISALCLAGVLRLTIVK